MDIVLSGAVTIEKNPFGDEIEYGVCMRFPSSVIEPFPNTSIFLHFVHLKIH